MYLLQYACSIRNVCTTVCVQYQKCMYHSMRAVSEMYLPQYACSIRNGVWSAGVVVTLARKYRVSLPVLTAVAQVLNGHLNAKEAVYEIMNLPQIEER